MKLLAALLITFAAALTSRADSLPSQVLAEMNLARTAPREYAAFVAARASGGSSRSRAADVRDAVRFLERATPLPPLVMSSGLSQAALQHVADQGRRGGIGHTGTDGSHSWNRMGRFGKWVGSAGENIHYGSSDARSIVISLIIDSGVPGKKHRKNIFSRTFRIVGIGCGAHARYGAMCVTDFAGGVIERDSAQIARL